jgi:hypothetical protein
MSKGVAYQLTGILMRDDRGLVLAMPGGGAWALDPPLFCRTGRMLGHKVHVVGTRSGFDLIDARTIEMIS